MALTAGVLERWTQHMPREIAGWLTGYRTDLLIKSDSFNSNGLRSGCEALCVAADHRSELFVRD